VTAREPGRDPDSRARTHLANERTFLAWLRTGLSLVALGLGSAQFLQQDLVPGMPVTALFAAFLVTSGVVMTAFAAVHYAHGRAGIDAGAFRPAGRAVVVGTALVAIAGIAALALVLLLRMRG
jgi:putative membrane protein